MRKAPNYFSYLEEDKPGDEETDEIPLLSDDEIEEMLESINRRLKELEEEERKQETGNEGGVAMFDALNGELDLKLSLGGCNTMEEERAPLAILKIPTSKNWSKASDFCGTFKMDKYGDLVFDTKINSTARADLPFLTNFKDELLPLIDFYVESECPVQIVGNAKKNRFYIKGIHHLRIKPNDAEKRKKFEEFMHIFTPGWTDAHLQYILCRLLEETQSTDQIPNFSVKQELELLFRLCKETYPPEIQDWAKHNFDLLSVSTLGSDDKRHALKALSYVLNIDWTVHIPDIPDLDTVKKELDQRFYGLESVKQQILEVAAQIRHTHTLPKWGILLHGPAGVGKTSIANAIADVLGLPKAYIEFSVVRDSEGVSGSSRVYYNAAPGLIITQLYRYRTANLVMVLNEIDKAAAAKDRSNPLDVMLPLLDGMGFTDTYLEVAIPTQGIFFIATCNEVDPISRPILDRFYRIDIPAYTINEKKTIFEKYVLPRTLERAQISADTFAIEQNALNMMLSEYTIEPGVRDLEKFAERLAAHFLLVKETQGIEQIVYDENTLRNLFGPPKVISRNYMRAPGMVFTAYVHDGSVRVITIQALLHKGEGSLKLVNVNSDSQSEYCRMAYEFTKSMLPNIFDHIDVTLAINHPLCESAHNYVGLAACAAILSAVRGIPFSPNIIFWGGCDLLGTFYLDENDISLLLQAIGCRFDMIYSAQGAAQQAKNWRSDLPLSIVEIPHGEVLLELAGLKRRNRLN